MWCNSTTPQNHNQHNREIYVSSTCFRWIPSQNPFWSRQIPVSAKLVQHGCHSKRHATLQELGSGSLRSSGEFHMTIIVVSMRRSPRVPGDDPIRSSCLLTFFSFAASNPTILSGHSLRTMVREEHENGSFGPWPPATGPITCVSFHCRHRSRRSI